MHHYLFSVSQNLALDKWDAPVQPRNPGIPVVVVGAV
jgi:hypothetical protein